MSQNNKNLDLDTFPDLRSFFFDGLSKINQRSLMPVPEGLLLYSSDVLERYSLSSDFYCVENGKVSEKLLGLNILQAEAMETEKKRKVYKDVGDTALVLVGYFSNSINTKLLDKNYYIKIGQMAYQKMDPFYPDYLDIPGFYKMLSSCFETLTLLLKSFSEKNRQDPFRHLLLNDISDKENLINGINPYHMSNVC